MGLNQAVLRRAAEVAAEAMAAPAPTTRAPAPAATAEERPEMEALAAVRPAVVAAALAAVDPVGVPVPEGARVP